MRARALVDVALYAAILAVLGLLPKLNIPFLGGVPITAQSLGVMLAGVMLGARQGALAVLLFLFVVALGAPLLAGGRGGLGVFAGPTVGFLAGWVAGAYVTGAVMARLRHLPVLPAALIAAAIGGVLVVYLLGVPVMAAMTGLPLSTAVVGSLVFVPGDLLKVVATGLVARAVEARRPELMPSRS